ncbi:redoxin domain-containing protein [Nesterenkonia flava]|uniref:Redoxin domain-containing protein n=1 Tax=Nesterenkonia flava TaxID=469799 RepID=A0ABU1FST7_9MICC|nr:redoxin domain-containing protein [Nesterenkonia flava]MDR5711720.1 redoxin domain-containing protein [Nesterenkonia flava]
MSHLLPGQPAPRFTARTQHGETLTLEELAGRPVLVMFYPYAFSRVCTSELQAMAARAPEVRDSGAEVLAVSCDAVHTLRAYGAELSSGLPAGEVELPFRLISDFWPHGELAQAYGVLNSATGAPERTSIILDAQLLVRHVIASPAGQARDLEQTLQLLRGLS